MKGDRVCDRLLLFFKIEVFMPFTAIYALPGRGKSLLMLQRALIVAEKYHLRVVSNFQLDPIQLAYYCKINNYKWLMENIPKGVIYYFSANRNFAQFLQANSKCCYYS